MVVSEKILGHRLYQMYPFKFKLMITLCNYYLFSVYGMLYFIPSVSLLDLTYILGTDLSVSAHGITLRAVAYSIGSICCGSLFQAIDRRLVLILGLLTASICLMTLPFMNVVFFFISMFVQGLISGSIDVAVNSWILDLWGDNCNTYMQALHASYGIGMALGPLFTAPFLGLKPPPTNETQSNSTDVTKGFIFHDGTKIAIRDGKSLDTFNLVFALASIAILIAAIIQTVIYFIENRKRNQIMAKLRKDGNALQALTTGIDPVHGATSSMPDGESKFVLILGAAILFVYVGMEVNSFNFVTEFFSFLYPNEPNRVEIAAHQATIMNSCFCAFRIIGIFVSRFLVSDVMVLIHLSMIVVSSVILLFSQTSMALITVGLSLFGAGCATIFPCVYSMIEERTKLSNFHVGLLMFAGSVASVIYPIVVPRLLEAFPMIYVYNNVISIAIVCACVITLVMKAKKTPKM